MIEKLKPAADAAGELGITLGLEPYRQTSGTLATSLPEVIEMIDATGRPNIKIIVDVWHYWTYRTAWPSWARTSAGWSACR